MKNNSYWQIEAKPFHFKNKSFSKTDVLIIGGGITGIMTAYELSKNDNLNITLVTKDRLMNGVTAKTSAKITPIHNLLYQDIKRIHGLDKAKQYYQSQIEAVRYILDIILHEHIHCHLSQEPNYMVATDSQGLKKLDKEIAVLKQMDVPIKITTELPLELPCLKAMVYEENYLFHPIKYLNHIVEILQKKENVAILEDHQAIRYHYKNNTYTVDFTRHSSITARHVVVATHYPIFNFEGLYPGKLYQEKSYLVAFRSKRQLRGMYINTNQPVRSMRKDKDTIILLGNSHKTGKNVDEKKRMSDIKKSINRLDKNAEITHTWTNQDVVSIDYLPFIGAYSRMTPNMYVATAFATWGMTNSHLAAIILAKEILKQPNPYRELYSPLRFSHLKSITESVKMIGKSIDGLLLSRIAATPIPLEKLKKQKGAIVTYQGKRYGAYHNKTEYLLVKPNCTHTNCFLQWNELEKTWDCKCHGSRFDIYGKVIEGPAIKDLELIKIKKT